MAKSTHQKELERARARRAAERAERKRARTMVVALVAVLVTGALVLGGLILARGGDEPEIGDPVSQESEDPEGTPSDDVATEGGDGTQTDAAAAATPCPPAGDDVPEPSATPYDEQPTADLGGATTVTATIVTTCGTVVLELDAAGSPNTVANFVALAEDGYYEGVGFHRVIDDFMIQGGDPTGTGSGCADEECETRFPGYTFEDELATAEALVEQEGLYPRGTLAMANAGANTNGSQFFIVQEDPGYALPPAYAVFGRVLEGLDVVDRIALGPAEDGIAVDPVVILSVEIAR